jgi:hypothetical protein
MPETVKKIQSSFNAGELSPMVAGRIDLEKFYDGCDTLENWLPLPHGGITRRPGMPLAALPKHADKTARLIPFELSRSVTYALEFGDAYIRVLRDGAQVQASGTERVTNGSFDLDITNWTVHSGSADWHPAGGIVFDGTSESTPDVVYQALTTVVGQRYRVTVEFSSPTVSIVLLVGNAIDSGGLVLWWLDGAGTQQFEFTATATTTYLTFHSNHVVIPGMDPPPVLPRIVYSISCQDVVTGAYEIASPYTLSDLPDLFYEQSADVVYLFHPRHAPRKLMRYGDADWEIKEAVRHGPTKEDPAPLPATITPAATSGSGKLFTPSADVFLAADVGRRILYRDAIAVIRSLSADAIKVATCDILSAFPNTNEIPASKWTLGGSPNTTLTPTAQGMAGDVVTLNLGAVGFRATDVGKYVRGNSGVAKILSIGSPASSAKAEIIRRFASTTAIVAGAWTLETSAWAAGKYPSCGCLHEQRLWAGGVAGYPNNVWGSASGDYADFTRGALDSDGVEYLLSSRKAIEFQWMASVGRAALVGGLSGESRLMGGNEAPITPANINVRTDTTLGSSNVQPVLAHTAALFVQRGGKKIQEVEYSYTKDGYEANDLTLLAEHITTGGIIRIAYQQTPEPRLWALRADGVLLSMTHNKGQNVVGWSRVPTTGTVEDLICIHDPGSKEDRVYVLVDRTTPGAPRRTIEYLSRDALLDSSLSYAGAPTSSVSGLTHLEGREVSVVADGEYVGTKTVASGAIALDAPASAVEVGLLFVPCMVTMEPEQPGTSPAKGRKKRWIKCWIDVYNTRGLVVNGKPQEGSAPFTGGIEVVNTGYDDYGRLRIEQPYPYPATVLALFGDLSVGD